MFGLCARCYLVVQERAGELVVAILARDVGVSVVEARGEMANILGRLAGDGGQNAHAGNLKERGGGGLNELANISEHLWNVNKGSENSDARRKLNATTCLEAKSIFAKVAIIIQRNDPPPL